jgi:hypothetical protein
MTPEHQHHETCLIHEQKVKEIIKKEIEGLELDFRSAKNWILGLCSALLLGMFSVGVWVGTIDNRVSSLNTAQIRLEDRIENRLVRIEALIINIAEKVGR